MVFTLPALAENTILIMGDSLSAGYGIETKQGWVALLVQRLLTKKIPYRVINASISGATTSNGLDQLPKLLQQYQPDITIIELGANDGLRGLPPALIKDNLTHMISLAKKAKSKVLLLALRLPPNYGEIYTQQYQQIFLTVAKAEHINIVPFFLNKVDDNPAMIQADGLHPRAEAQLIILDNVWPELEKLLTH